MYRRIIKPILFSLPIERAHRIALLLLRIIDPDFSTPATLELAFFNVGILVTCAPILYFFAPAFYTFTGMEILMIYGAITVIGIAAMFALKLVGQKQW